MASIFINIYIIIIHAHEFVNEKGFPIVKNINNIFWPHIALNVNI